jgi:hypothetical protein
MCQKKISEWFQTSTGMKSVFSPILFNAMTEEIVNIVSEKAENETWKHICKQGKVLIWEKW